jgi:hypothetical protein
VASSCKHFIHGVCQKTSSGCPAANTPMAFYPLGCEWCSHPEWRTGFATPSRPAEDFCAWCGSTRPYTGAFLCDCCGGTGLGGSCPDCGGAGVY